MIIENGVLIKVEEKDIKKGLLKSDGVEKIVELPSEVHTIGKYAFMRSNVDTVVFTENLKRIEEYAFCNSAIEKMHISGKNGTKGVISLPETVEFIGRDAFSHCSKILAVNINSKEIGESAFERSRNIGVIYLGEKVEKIGNYAFKMTRIKSFDMKNKTNVTLGRGIFSFVDGIENVKLPDIFFKPYVNPNQNEFGEAKGEVENGHIFYATKEEWN